MADLKTNSNELTEVLTILANKVDSSTLQPKTDPGLQTNDITVVGAINEVNNKTVDKMVQLNLASGSCIDAYIDEWGIAWDNDEYEIEVDDGSCYHGRTHDRVPLVAGENVTFEIDEENQVVKINATGGTNNDSMIGTWVFNETISNLAVDGDKSFLINFTSYCPYNFGNFYSAFNFQPAPPNNLTYGRNGPSVTVYDFSENVWLYEDSRIFNIVEEPDNDEIKNWIKANAVKQVAPSLPSCDTSNNGQFLMVVNGVPAWASIPNAEEVEF